MRTLFKTMFIVGLCGVGVVAAAHVVLGKQRTHDAARALTRIAQHEIDELIQRQHDFQRELEKLRAEYPRHVAAIRSQLSEVARRESELDREEQRAADIVRLCEEDISYLEDQRAVIGNAHADHRLIEHRGSRYSVAEAETLTGRIAGTRSLYVDRAADILAERAVLATESEQLEIELHELQAEQAEFEAEYNSLLRELDRLKRNEELLKIRERKHTGAERHGEAMRTLSDVKASLEKARFEQEERMKAARITRRSLDYETRAKLLEVRRKREANRRTSGTAELPAPRKAGAEYEVGGEDEAIEFAGK